MRFLGIDDWLLYGEDDKGRQYCNVLEGAGIWLEAPNKGEAEYGTKEWAADWRYVILELKKAPDTDIPWEAVPIGLRLSSRDRKALRHNALTVYGLTEGNFEYVNKG